MKRLAILILGLIGLSGFTVDSRAQNPSTYVQWGVAGSSSTNGVLDATRIPITTSSNGVRYSNVNGLGYDIVVTTTGLTQSGEGPLPWNGDQEWWYEGATASREGDSIPYSTIQFNFYQQGTNIPFGVTGVNFTYQNAKIGERYRYFNYQDTVGNQVALSFTNYIIFSYPNGTPDIHLSDSSIDSGIPYVPGNIEGDWIGVDMSFLAISGFSFQTGRVDSNYGSNFLTALGFLVPTGQLLIQSGADTNITNGPCFVTTGSDAVLTPSALTGILATSNAAVITGSSISQNIVINEDILSGSGNSLTMCASQNIVSATSSVSLTSTSGNAGNLTLNAVQSDVTNHLEACAATGTGGNICINAGNNINVTSGIDTSASGPPGEGGNINLQAGNDLTVDSIRSGGGGGFVGFGAPGNITLTADNSISVGAIYDDSNPSYNPQAVFTAPSIALGQPGAYYSDIAGTLYLEHPVSAAGATVAISAVITGTANVVIDTGTGSASLYTYAGYVGETDVLSGLFAAQGNSLLQSEVVLNNASSFSPGVTTAGGYVGVNSLTVGTNATLNITLTSTTTYDQVQSAGAVNLDGIFELTVPDGFAPVIGQVFQVMTFPSVTGSFGSYEGVRLSDCVLVPVLTGTNLSLVTSAVPTGASQPLQTVPPGGLDVSAGGYYDGLTTTLQTADPVPFLEAATLIDGTASEATTVTMSLAATGTNDYQLQGSLGETLLNLYGTGSDKVVVQLDYNEAAALATAGDERKLFLASSTGGAPFANAVLANTNLPGETNNPTEFLRAYNPATDFHLGYYGVDTVNNRVWAVVDYDAYFGLGATNIAASPAGPASATEPAAGVLAVSATVNGLVNFNGYNSTAVFDWSTTPTMAGSTVGAAVASGSAASFAPVTYMATGLLPYTTYYFRTDAITTSGTQYGGIFSFTTPLSAINYWRYTYFGTYTNSGNAADTANPSGDGIANLLKYATGMSPLVPSATQPAVMGQTGSGDGAYLTLTFNEIADPILTYSVQATNDLVTWATIWTSTGASNSAGSVTVQDVVPISEQPGRFLRLVVSY
jgi:hypothetical protein